MSVAVQESVKMSQFSSPVLFLVTITCWSIMLAQHVTSGHKILVVSSPVGGSHALHMNQVANMLASNTSKHSVTLLRNTVTGSIGLAPTSKPRSTTELGANPRVIVVEDPAGERIFARLAGAANPDPVFGIWNRTDVAFMMDVMEMFTQVCQSMLAETGLWEELAREQFDVVIVNEFQSYCVLGYVDHYINAPVITYHTTRLLTASAYMHGVPYPPSYSQTTVTPLRANMTNAGILDRFKNLINYLLETSLFGFAGPVRIGNQVLAQYLGKDAPDVKEVVAKTSLVVVHSDWSIEDAKPIVPNVVMVGGILCRSPEPLPEDLAEIVSNATKGVVYVSFGTVLNTGIIGTGIVDMLLDAFSDQRLAEYTFLWKLDTTPDWRTLPGNVEIREWLPQQDILGHRKVKLFVSHGGLHSTYEAIYHSTPTLVIPVFADQRDNGDALARAGLALVLKDKNNLDADQVVRMMLRLLKAKKYRTAAKARSRILRDYLPWGGAGPLQRLLQWVEYVVRHQGAPHLRVNSHSLGIIRYYNMDILAILAAAGVAWVWLVVKVVTRLVRTLRYRGVPPAGTVETEKKTQ